MFAALRLSAWGGLALLLSLNTRTALGQSTPARTVSIEWRTETSRAAVEVSGVDAGDLSAWARGEASAQNWARILAVYAEQTAANTDVTLPPMVGAWRIVGDRLRFEPAFPLTHGVRYRAEFSRPGAAPLISFFELPARATKPATSVARIFPIGNELPENQLKFYVHFSAPMSRGGVYEHIQIRDAAGRPVDAPFLELDEELWDLSMTRLTLLIDPGRIKRGVKPLEDIGPVFEAGHEYALSIGPACRDAEGRGLGKDFVKRFRVVLADRTPPDPARWKIHPPAIGTRQELRVEFDEPMDEALAARLVTLIGPGAAKPRGEIRLTTGEREWRFDPAEPWAQGRYALRIAATIEDLAGNNIGKSFDVELSEGGPRRHDVSDVSIDFEIK